MRGLKIFSLAFFSYLALSLYSNYFDEELRNVIYSKGFEPSMLLLGTVYAVAFFSVFALGYVSRIKLSPSFLIMLLLVLSFYDAPLAPIITMLVLLAYLRGMKFPWLLSDAFLLVAFLIPLGLYTTVGVPFFERSLRYELVGPLVLASILAVVGLAYSRLSMKWKTVLVMGYTLIFYLGTFRSLILLVYLAYSLDVWLRHPHSGKWIAIVSLIPASIILLMSGGIEAILIRVGFTFLVFHNLVRLSLPVGYFHGALLLSNNPRSLVAGLFDATTNYTYFFFGQPIADFGVFGLAEAFLLGAFLRESERTPESLTVVLSLMLYSIDPGVDALILMFIMGSLLFLHLEHS